MFQFPLFVVEHMEEEYFEWSHLEYMHIANTIGMKEKCSFVVTSLPTKAEDMVGGSFGHVSFPSWKYFEGRVPRQRICLLDEKASATLSSSDADVFDVFLAGGILGDVDEMDLDRTSELRNFGFASRNLGPVQMTLDTAILAAHRIIKQGIPFEDLGFVDRPEFELAPNETLIMPFRYLKDNEGLPLLPSGMRELWNRDQFCI